MAFCLPTSNLLEPASVPTRPACWHAIAAGRHNRRRCAQRKGNVTVACVVDLLLHFGLLRHTLPIREHGHYPVLPHSDEDMRLIRYFCAHGLRLVERGNSAPRAGSSSPSRPRHRSRVLHALGRGSAHIAVARRLISPSGASPGAAVASVSWWWSSKSPSRCASPDPTTAALQLRRAHSVGCRGVGASPFGSGGGQAPPVAAPKHWLAMSQPPAPHRGMRSVCHPRP